MRIAIIGAGAAGLAALRESSKNIDTINDDKKITQVICYEKGDQIGGTWVYTEKTGTDQYGLKIHSSMYNNLRTNLPKEVMGYPGFPNNADNPRSYLTRTEILNYLNQFCDHYNLRKYINVLHNVEMIEPTNDASKNKWMITVKNLMTGIVKTEYFDGVMVCNGHYFEPSIPVIDGQEKFQGSQLHSHDYRVPEIFEGKTVVVIGAGPSGMDLALEISRKAKKVFLSHHNSDPINTVFPENIVMVPDVVQLSENEAIFKNDQREKVDVIFYCTGYKYSYPFLSNKCGVEVKDNMVTPLWKHLVSIKNPTLAFVGLPFYVCAFNMCDLQVRFVLRYWLGDKQLPPEEIMQAEEAAELERKTNQGLKRRHFHMMGPEQGNYYDDLANTAGVEQLPPVLTKLHNSSSNRFLDDLVHYREDRYKVVDDFNFVKL